MSILRACTNGAKILTKKFGYKVVKKAPDLLIFGGIGAIAAGSYFVAKGAIKSVDILADESLDMDDLNEMEEGEERAKAKLAVKKETAWKLFKAYAPAIIFMTTGVGMILCGRGIMKKRYLALSSAYAALNETLDNYRSRVRNEVGDEKEYNLFHDIHEETVEYTDENGKKKKKNVKQIGGSGHPLEFIFDEANDHWKGYPGSNYYVLLNAASTANNKLYIKGYLTLAEVLEDLRMPVPSWAFYTGWIKDDMNKHKITFGTEANYDLRDGKETNAILTMNCDPDFLVKVDEIEKCKYGYRTNIA